MTMATTLFRPGDRPLLHLGLLGATAVTTFGAFRLQFGDFRASITFSACLLLILGSHEMGHYVLARLHGVDTSLPYFIPFPLLGIGTLGAVIRIRSRIPNRNALVDIGAAGPLAGLAVALPLLVYGLMHSPLKDSGPMPSSGGFLGDASLWHLASEFARYILARLHGELPPVKAVAEGPMTLLFGDNLLTLGLQHLVRGPLPEGTDIEAHPAFLAAWFGLLVTMLNLIPIGQLDGGHLTYALFGTKARTLGKAMALLMLGLCIFASASWIVWLLLTAGLVGFRHPEVSEPQGKLTRGRRWVCALCGLGFLLCMMPIPLRVING
jgi:membrane-associated protease RseP (regulator of RpoE activity)